MSKHLKPQTPNPSVDARTDPRPEREARLETTPQQPAPNTTPRQTKPNRTKVIASLTGLALGLTGGLAWGFWADRQHNFTASLRTPLMAFNVFNANTENCFGGATSAACLDYLKANPVDVLQHVMAPSSSPTNAYKVAIDTLTRGDVHTAYSLTVSPTAYTNEIGVVASHIAREASCPEWDGVEGRQGQFYKGPLSGLTITNQALIHTVTPTAYQMLPTVGSADPDPSHYRGAQDTLCLQFYGLVPVEHENEVTVTADIPGQTDPITGDPVTISANDTWSGTFTGFDYFTIPTTLNFQVAYAHP